MFRSVLRIFMFCLASLACLVTSSAHATSQLYKRECNGCHSSPPTCNGCHAHGVHGTTGDTLALNLVAKTDKANYSPGDDISVTLSGGNQPQAENGWVGFKLYNEEGVELGHIKSELPATITTRAYAGMTTLYMAWIGHEYDGAGAKYGTPIGTPFGAGRQDSFRAGVHLQELHIEEVVATNAFTVGNVTPESTDDSTANGSSKFGTGADNSANGGGGSFDPLFLVSLSSVVCALRRRAKSRLTR